MGNRLNIKYQKVADLDNTGNVFAGPDFTALALSDSEEATLGFYGSFEELSEAVNPKTIMDVLAETEGERFLTELVEITGGLEFNNRWYTLEELKKLSIQPCKKDDSPES